MTSKRQGFTALVTTLIIMMVVMIFLAASQNISTTGLSGTLDRRFGTEAYYVAQSCFQDTLIRLRSDSSYSGDSLNVSDGFCTITVSGGGSTKTVTVDATVVNDYYSTITATVNIVEGTETTEIQVQNYQID